MNKILLIALFLTSFISYAQRDKHRRFKEYYPISIRPDLSVGLGNNEYEEILLEARPVVYYGIYNDLRKALNKDTITNGDAVYLSFQPQFRIYNEDSKPVKTPSYKLLIGWQKIIKTNEDNFFTAAIESGHYSNGQAESAFSTEFDDNSEESIALYNSFTDDTDLAKLLNRSGGNFSTNLTRLSVNYRFNTFNEVNIPQKIHSFTATYQLYHNKFLGFADFGGYNPEDIDILGRHQLEFGYEFTSHLKKMRYTLSQQFNYTIGSHPSSVPYRSETSGILYPWNSDLGILAQFSIGRDDYNYRFLDDFARFKIGITWDWFTPFVVKPTKNQQLPTLPKKEL
ncbi:hypothetical protein LY01_01337 [Nonlabens xylanidelens]|uniref:Uncharacterized protein n=1 Tax=Nonlabens xylanidelens TaxID=191564 RepID=A0A2S6INC2_9FLAO|nr:hypothetical protein [Nonlabens xylanidelens]PPK95744.1 hypothetical protein LY01_01337 [Nonlabens xylanidelens]PQJ22537.1 hypothetical protein BST94_02905 [Nonlabens xylanidelens]